MYRVQIKLRRKPYRTIDAQPTLGEAVAVMQRMAAIPNTASVRVVDVTGKRTLARMVVL